MLRSSVIVLLALIASVGAGTTSCSSEGDSYTVDVTEGHPVYVVSRPGGFLREERFDTVLVFGFNDNREIAQQIAQFLNQQEPNTYTYYRNQCRTLTSLGTQQGSSCADRGIAP